MTPALRLASGRHSALGLRPSRRRNIRWQAARPASSAPPIRAAPIPLSQIKGMDERQLAATFGGAQARPPRRLDPRAALQLRCLRAVRLRERHPGPVRRRLRSADAVDPGRPMRRLGRGAEAQRLRAPPQSLMGSAWISRWSRVDPSLFSAIAEHTRLAPRHETAHFSSSSATRERLARYTAH